MCQQQHHLEWCESMRSERTVRILFPMWRALSTCTSRQMQRLRELTAMGLSETPNLLDVALRPSCTSTWTRGPSACCMAVDPAMVRCGSSRQFRFLANSCPSRTVTRHRTCCVLDRASLLFSNSRRLHGEGLLSELRGVNPQCGSGRGHHTTPQSERCRPAP